MRADRLLAQGQVIANENWKGRAVLKVDYMLNTFEAILDDAVSPELIEVLEKELTIQDDSELLEQTPVPLRLSDQDVSENSHLTAAASNKANKKTKNVAMEAILRQAASTDTKQVTFKTPSPNFSDDSNSQPSSNISQEDLRSNLPAYMLKAPKATTMATNVAPIRMDFSVPPPPLMHHRPFLPHSQPTVRFFFQL